MFQGDTENDTWIFVLAVLLSSTLIYNSKGTIDQQAMDNLQYPLWAHTGCPCSLPGGHGDPTPQFLVWGEETSQRCPGTCSVSPGLFSLFLVAPGWPLSPKRLHQCPQRAKCSRAGDAPVFRAEVPASLAGSPAMC